MIDLHTPEVRSILPYRSQEDYQFAVMRLLQDQSFSGAMQKLLPESLWNSFIQAAPKVSRVEEFHRYVVAPLVDEILKSTSQGLSVSGLDELKLKSHRFLILSNHRDIVCDPAIVAYCFFNAGLGSPFICLGDNLLTQARIIDLVKLNRGITVKRDLPPRELLKWSGILSQVIHELITRENESVWIAQREGRAKDGDDRTHPGVLKMLAMAGQDSILDAMSHLHLLPVAISYEYDPCDALKARELYRMQTFGSYEKFAHEDEMSMRAGILGFKGRIHVGFGSEWNTDHLKLWREKSKRDQINALVQSLDQEIHRQYMKWPSNFIAFDLLHGGDEMSARYSQSEKQMFVERMNTQLSMLVKNKLAQDSELEGIKTIMIKSYAKPIEVFE